MKTTRDDLFCDEEGRRSLMALKLFVATLLALEAMLALHAGEGAFLRGLFLVAALLTLRRGWGWLWLAAGAGVALHGMLTT